MASKPKKIKAKGTVRELKIVHSVSRRGADIVTTEEVKTLGHVTPKTSLCGQPNQSSSPTKRQKLDNWDSEPIPCHLEGSNDYKERQTLVFLLLL
jgi:hypothetical protein